MRASVVGFVLVFICGVAIAYHMITDQKKLPIYNPADLNPDLVDESLRSQRSKHRIAAFDLINQDGERFTEAGTEGKIYVADFFFTTCPSICPKMTKQMHRVQEEYGTHQDFMILSYSVQPEVDSPSVLMNYAQLNDAQPGTWQFLTGDKKQIYDLARKSYFAATTEGDGGVNDFIHTENFVLVDKEKRIRGMYDGTSTEEVDQLIEDIEILMNSYE